MDEAQGVWILQQELGSLLHLKPSMEQGYRDTPAEKNSHVTPLAGFELLGDVADDGWAIKRLGSLYRPVPALHG